MHKTNIFNVVSFILYFFPFTMVITINILSNQVSPFWVMNNWINLSYYILVYLLLCYLSHVLFSVAATGWRGWAKMAYPSVFLKYLQNYLLNWLKIFKVWFSNCLKAVLENLLKIGTRKALNHALSWMTPYRKKSPKFLFSFFSIIFHFLTFPCCVCYLKPSFLKIGVTRALNHARQ